MDVATIAIYVAVMIAASFTLNLGGWWSTVRVFDRLGRRLPFHQFVAVRHLRGRKSGFVTAIGIFSIVGVSFSSCTLTTVLSVMGGFSEDLKHKILATNAHVVVDNYGADLAGLVGEDGKLEEGWGELLERVRGVEGVLAATPVVQAEVMMNARTNNHGILLKGIDPASFSDVSRVLDELDKGEVGYLAHPERLFAKIRERRARLYGLDDEKPDRSAAKRAPPGVDGGAADGGPTNAGADAGDGGPAVLGADSFVPAPKSPRGRVLPAVIVGRELASSLRLYEGEEVNIISPIGDIGPTGPIPKSRPFRVGGVFFSGMYEFDSLYVYMGLEDAQRFLRKGDRISEIHVAVEEPDRADAVGAAIRAALGERLRVRAWQELNASLFSALKLEKIVMFIFLSLAIVVASFCIIATLSMLVIEKEGEISILMTLGATGAAVRRVFRFEGLLIGLVGTVSGLLVGIGLCLSLEHVGLPIDPEVWYIDALPVSISPFEVAAVGVASLATTQIATFIATLVASKPNPVEGLKNG